MQLEHDSIRIFVRDYLGKLRPLNQEIIYYVPQKIAR